MYFPLRFVRIAEAFAFVLVLTIGFAMVSYADDSCSDVTIDNRTSETLSMQVNGVAPGGIVIVIWPATDALAPGIVNPKVDARVTSVDFNGTNFGIGTHYDVPAPSGEAYTLVVASCSVSIY